jgi:ribonuclease P protein component
VLPRELRLRENRHFQFVYRRGRSWADRHLVVHALPRSEPERRFGFVVGKKLGGAVQRNRVRRLLREACWAVLEHVPAGVHVVNVARAAAGEASLAELTTGMRSLFQRAGLWVTDAAAPYRFPGAGSKPRPEGLDGD